MENTTKKIGEIKQEVITLLDLKHIKVGTPIRIGTQNIEHIKSRHPAEFDMYFDDIELIINFPDYVGKNPKDDSITYVKLYEVNNEYIRVGVKIASSGIFYVRTLHLLSTYNAEKYIKRGTLIKFKKL